MKKETGTKQGNTDLSVFPDLRGCSEKQLLEELAGKELALNGWEYDSARLEDVVARLPAVRARVARAAIELYKRKEARFLHLPGAGNSREVFELMYPLLSDLVNEEFWIVALNSRLKVIARQRISFGGLTETVVDVRMVFRFLLTVAAVRFVAVHNHPSGDARPSRLDDVLTKHLQESGELLNIRLADHLIIGNKDCYSYQLAGRLG